MRKNIFCLAATRVFLSTLTLLMLSEVSAQVRVTRISSPDGLTGKKGVVYTLPQSVIEVELSFTKTQQVPGPLAHHAKDYLGLNDVITKSSVTYSMENADIRSITTPDQSRVYLIEKEEKSAGEIWLAFDKSSQVMLMEKFIKETKPQGFAPWKEIVFATPQADQLFPKYSEASTREVFDTIIRKISIDTLIIEEKIFKRSMVGFTDREKAEEAMDKIKQIEQDKYNLLVGYQETAYSKDAMEFMYNKLEEERLEYRKLFTGMIIQEKYSAKFYITPNPALEGQTYKLTGFSRANGLVPVDTQNAVTLVLGRGEPLVGMADSSAVTETTGLVYRLPEMADAVVSYQGVKLGREMIEVKQFGPVYKLPPEFKRVEFDLKTGMLKSLVIE